MVAMSFQDYQGEVDPQVEHEIPGAEFRAHMMQLTQIQLVQIVSSAVCQALTQQMQQIIYNQPPSATTVNHVAQNTTACSATGSTTPPV